jgi:hypothetical protein
MNSLTTFDIDEICAYCNVDTILIMRCFSKNMFEKYVLKYFENTILLSKIVKEIPNDILICGIYNNSERIVKYALSKTMTNGPGMDICRYSIDSISHVPRHMRNSNNSFVWQSHTKN